MANILLGYVNCGYMDFYDIYLLNRKLDFYGEELEKSIQLIFEHRKIMLDDILYLKEILLKTVRECCLGIHL